MQKVVFPQGGSFHEDLRREVDAYLAAGELPRRDLPAMRHKTVVMFLWFAVSWAALVLGPLFGPMPFWLSLISAVSLGLAVAGIGFSVQHDANHGAYSERSGLNRLMGFSMDLLGASSFVWRFKHNVVHHTYTNVTGHDDDIELQPLARMSPHQARRPWHRLQKLYMWPLYCVIHLKWVFVDDFVNIAQGRVAKQKLPKMNRADVIQLIIGKIVGISWLVVIPFLVSPQLLPWMLLVTATTGLVLAITFQLAHCVEDADFMNAQQAMPYDWAVHQLHTTLDFAPKSRLLTWYMGGLNFQVEHHLFPRISHVHYPEISKLVEETCREFRVPFAAHPTFLSAVRSHFRWLERMGAAPRPQTSPSVEA
jgi:linoleoyl-CoA desaturase